MKVYVDADACPVKNTIISAAQDFDVPVVLVKSISHFSHDDEQPGVETVYVDTGAEAADYRIIQLAQTRDIIITQDYGLASLGLSKGCTVLHHKGFAYTNRNIDQLLQTRYANAKARKSGKRTKGPKAFTSEDEMKFRNLFWKTLEEAR
ncbi:YaiI/YqxD family protein [Lentibacillus sp.]|uniref:YaiI/YqxD family protein n=1 Tax=Lentibacillus sp. TaxID=1925746 RepID=UPI002B4B025E|nr:YaiI/YqxD family protein [Lentibacillus sp.]HLS10198.1 YaiI/YqxD family protein [Lentibacillus sp.]